MQKKKSMIDTESLKNVRHEVLGAGYDHCSLLRCDHM
jgi:hypothetical protein